jgi:hypothetical protein
MVPSNLKCLKFDIFAKSVAEVTGSIKGNRSQAGNQFFPGLTRATISKYKILMERTTHGR